MRLPREPNVPEPGQHNLYFTPYLYIRAFGDDQGQRALAKNAVFWVSPDIDFYPKLKGNALENTAVTVAVNIWNDGYLPAVGVSIDFYWFTPAPVFIPTESNHINKEPVRRTIPAQSCLPVECPQPWVPTFIGDGHECLVVQCKFFLEGSDSLRFPFHAELDRHVGQLNLTVSPASMASTMELVIHNPFDTRVNFLLFLSSLIVRGNFGHLREQDPDGLRRIVASARPGGPHNLIERDLHMRAEDTTNEDLGVHIVRVAPRTSGADRGMDLQHYLQQRGPATDNPLGRSLGQIDLRRFESKTVHLAAPPDTLEPGTFRVLHFSQVTAECIVGGYTVVIEG